ncbi:HlyD family type I secretion periplasmic adaptor subunit [Neorhizobium alkalisoli]|uniref:HlyD family type I secretion periplasmic adaptor subunit n=1 Tax=Neorhizobium alkalisoli TaxID=528178 RepID=UPI000CF8E92E|nr:HlyD family type I secretion periplasmic adaptor subunit [Neorhizobium alkalisoli]
MTREQPQKRKPIHRGDSEFLPAAIEILETPASPVRAALIWLICLFAALSLIWAYFGKFDIIATAQGKVQPVGRVKIVQSEEPGRIVFAKASNGTLVTKDEILIELDPTTAKAEEQALDLRLQALTGEIIRRQAVRETIRTWAAGDALSSSGLEGSRPVFPGFIGAAIAEREQSLYETELRKLSDTIANLSAQYQKAAAQVESLDNTIAAQQVFVSTLAERVAMRSRLVEAEAGTKAIMIDAQEALLEGERDLVSRRGERREAASALEVIKTEAASQFSIFSSENMLRLSDALREADQVKQELAKAKRKLAAMTIRSPEAGTVQASAITTVGQVLSPATELMRIVPADQKLEIEAFIPNRDIGFVAAGQEAVIKVEAFPFTRFGILHGEVSRVATDAIPEPDARQLEEMSSGPLQSLVPVTNVQRVQNLVYPVVIEPRETALNVNGKIVPLAPGMTVTIEVKTGQRRILEYLFSPLAEITSTAMGER